MSEAKEAQGTIIEIGTTDSPPEFIEIGEIQGFDGPGGTASVIDVSHLKSSRKEKRMGLPDEGQVTYNGNYLGGDEGQNECKAARAARELRPFRIKMTDGNTMSYDGYVLSFSRSGAVEEVYKFNMTVEITGEVTDAPTV